MPLLVPVTSAIVIANPPNKMAGTICPTHSNRATLTDGNVGRYFIPLLIAPIRPAEAGQPKVSA